MIHALIADLAAKKVDLKAEGDRLIVDGPESEVTDSLVERLRPLKAELILALSGSSISRDAGIEADSAEVKAPEQADAKVVEEWTGEDWGAFFDERAGIIEYEGGVPRPQAEVQAFECCVVEWLNRNPVRSPPERCLGCGSAENAYDPLYPHGLGSTGHAWLHGRCWPAWYAGRRQAAVAALSAMSVRVPEGAVVAGGSALGTAPGGPIEKFDDMPF